MIVLINLLRKKMEKNIKGKVSELENIIQSIVAKFDIITHNNCCNKPLMYNLWMIRDIKATGSDVTETLKKLSKNNFCKESEREKLQDELTRMQKVRLAVLPKSCIDSLIHDLKHVVQNDDFEFVLNEFVE